MCMPQIFMACPSNEAEGSQFMVVLTRQACPLSLMGKSKNLGLDKPGSSLIVLTLWPGDLGQKTVLSTSPN